MEISKPANQNYTPLELAVAIVYDEIHFILKNRIMNHPPTDYNREVEKIIREMAYELLERTSFKPTKLPERD